MSDNESSSAALPPLPEPEITAYQTDSVMRSLEVRSFTADQMRAYARAAIVEMGMEIIDLNAELADARAALAAQPEPAQPAPCQRCKGVIDNCDGDDCDGTGEYQDHWPAQLAPVQASTEPKA